MKLRPLSEMKLASEGGPDRIPAAWNFKRLKFLAKFQSGEGITSDEIREAGEYPVFGGNGLRGYTNRYTHDGDFVLIGRQGALCGNINYARGKFWASEHAVVATVRREHSVVWFGELLRALNLNQHSQSAAQPGLAVERIQNIAAPVPPPQEQKRIVKFLDAKLGRLDELMRKKERQLAVLAEKRQALISHAVTRGLNPKAPTKPSEVAWLGEIPAHWETKKLKYLVRFAGGATPDKSNSAFWNGTIPWVSPKDMKVEEVADTEDHITDAGLRNSATSLIAPGAVLIVVRSGILQHTIPVAINLVEVSLNQDMRALITNRLMDSGYLALVIRGLQDVLLTQWRKEGATVESLEYEFMSQCKLPLPSIEEQKQIVSWLTARLVQLKKAGEKLRTQLAKLHEYRQTLITAAVTGQVAIPEGAA